MITEKDITLNILTVCRADELKRTLESIGSFKNIQIIFNGANIKKYKNIITKYRQKINFIINKNNIGIAAGWNQAICLSDTQYVILSSDDLIYKDNWLNILLNKLNANKEIMQVSLCPKMTFSCFCINKKLITQMGWFDHNFVCAYYEDEDWCFRYREFLNLYNSKIKYIKIMPIIDAVEYIRHKKTPWNRNVNYLYFKTKWKKVDFNTKNFLLSREHEPFIRIKQEPVWKHLNLVQQYYKKNDFTKKQWKYDKPFLFIRLIAFITNFKIIQILLNPKLYIKLIKHKIIKK